MGSIGSMGGVMENLTAEILPKPSKKPAVRPHGRSNTVPRPRLVRQIAAAIREDMPDLEQWMIDADEDRPKTRKDCEGGVRPCPRVACKHNLYLDVNPDTGSIKFNFPRLEPGEMINSCSLDLADDDGMTLEAIGDAMNLTRERVRQMEVQLLEKLREEGLLS